MIKTCSKAGCFNEAVKPCGGGGTMYCYLHSRITQIRYNAKARGLSVPSLTTLEQMFNSDASKQCHHCGKVMIIHSDFGTRSDVVTLQHRDDGEYELLCHTCNAAHGNIGAENRDVFYDIPAGSKRCPRCERIFNFADFGRSKICKSCARIDGRAYYQRNRESRLKYAACRRLAIKTANVPSS